MKLPNPIQAWYHYVFYFIASTVYELYSIYIEFIDQPLHPSQFIPWDMENNCPMDKPPRYDDWLGGKPIISAEGKHEYWKELYKKYQQAEGKVLFEGFDEFDGWYKHWLLKGEFFMNGKQVQTIADLVDLVDIKDSVAEKLNLNKD